MPKPKKPKVIAVIPARGGSERVPRKNILPMNGIPLLAYTIRQALRSRLLSEVFVSTDDDEIARVARAWGAEDVRRPPALAGGRAPSEAALLHVLNERNRRGLADPDLVVFLQCTSPVRGDDDIDRAIRLFIERRADSLLSVTRNRRFLWSETRGRAVPLNYDFRRRPREQEIKSQVEENGSIYIFRPGLLRRRRNRLGGKIVLYEMGPWSAFQLDTSDDAELIDWILKRRAAVSRAAWPERIGLLVFDFDGVMTDNTVRLSRGGTESVRVNRGDGLGIRRLAASGVPMMVLSSETDPVVPARCAKLDLPCFYGVKDKAGFLKMHLAGKKIDAASVIYVGNDVNDLGCFELVGLPVAVADAHPDVLPAARIVLKSAGGRGAVREIADHVLRRAGHP